MTHKLEQSASVEVARQRAEVRRIEAEANMRNVMFLLMLWFAMWFSIAIAAGGVRTAQYIWQNGLPMFPVY